ncbi:hypothetical protein ABL78_6012 [Leptomonas seymouri]|uniref:Uncharacterized protein n=1 Tax=Leptomonas seymouri TaxID=5684 RepID=A0A0N1PA96_LEPSE|nr:hypothetical protein ABL78_6012 [Leptomonas seymouri]|eukprot:KPI84920.1 hypothetical protein ABL78_6012 [Leptomonas seymouri]
MAVAPQERQQWFHRLVYFTPLEYSPELTESDESGGEGEEHISAAPQTAAVAPAATATVGIPSHYEVDTNASGPISGARTQRPHMQGPVLQNRIPYTVQANNYGYAEDTAFGYHGGVVQFTSSQQQQQQQQRLSMQAPCPPARRSEEMPVPVATLPEEYSYAEDWGFDGEF